MKKENCNVALGTGGRGRDGLLKEKSSARRGLSIGKWKKLREKEVAREMVMAEDGKRHVPNLKNSTLGGRTEPLLEAEKSYRGS